jgi:alpha-1,3/alpha-1,6-mannosyltransferase
VFLKIAHLLLVMKSFNLMFNYFSGELRNKQENGLDGIQLIMAGGYDERVTENKEHYLELRQLTTDLDLNDHVTFLRSLSNAAKVSLLKMATALLYTPDREHFGIVPVESMYLRCPVIAVNSGGPLETIVDGVTGFHCAATPQRFASAMAQFIKDPNLSKSMGAAGRKRVEKKFSYSTMTSQLDDIVKKMVSS